MLSAWNHSRSCHVPVLSFHDFSYSFQGYSKSWPGVKRLASWSSQSEVMPIFVRSRWPFLGVFSTRSFFPAKRSTFTYSMSYIFWKLLVQRLILAINQVFWSILWGVRILLTHCNRIVHKIWPHVIVERKTKFQLNYLSSSHVMFWVFGFITFICA